MAQPHLHRSLFSASLALSHEAIVERQDRPPMNDSFNSLRHVVVKSMLSLKRTSHWGMWKTAACVCSWVVTKAFVCFCSWWSNCFLTAIWLVTFFFALSLQFDWSSVFCFYSWLVKLFSASIVDWSNCFQSPCSTQSQLAVLDVVLVLFAVVCKHKPRTQCYSFEQVILERNFSIVLKCSEY